MQKCRRIILYLIFRIENRIGYRRTILKLIGGRCINLARFSSAKIHRKTNCIAIFRKFYFHWKNVFFCSENLMGSRAWLLRHVIRVSNIPKLMLQFLHFSANKFVTFIRLHGLYDVCESVVASDVLFVLYRCSTHVPSNFWNILQTNKQKCLDNFEGFFFLMKQEQEQTQTECKNSIDC